MPIVSGTSGIEARHRAAINVCTLHGMHHVGALEASNIKAFCASMHIASKKLRLALACA